MFRIKEALENYNTVHKQNLTLMDLARVLYPDSSWLTQRTSMTKLANGHRKMINIEFIPVLCEMLKCDANFLFGIDGKKKK